MSVRRTLFRWGLAAIHRSRADRWLAPAARGCGVILMLHHVRPWRPRGFAPNRILEITPEFLDSVLRCVAEEGFEFVAMDEVPERLRRGKQGRPFVAVTFDDGYRDNVLYAAPVLDRHGAPWTMFVTTGFAERTASLWWLELEEAIRRLDHVALTIDGTRRCWPCRNDGEKSAAFDEIYWDLRAGREERLREVVGILAAQASVEGRALVEHLCLDWQGIAELARHRGVTIGAHTLTHPMLAKHSEAVARSEIVEAKSLIEARIGRSVRHLAYPVGDRGAAGPREFTLAREAGYATAVTTRPGHLFPEHDAHLTALPRVSINGAFQTKGAVRALLSGVPFLLWNRARRTSVT
ncbi:polysaccharide deacetylase family protein [Chelatococcus sp. SYSU_G07232]|uniref:Chitooligosaccharide deacetylase n=1 Tax=Chelatococcus albus TaxID=3047466 RepID=A0ABT7AE71_9HYPH|nr:polysaccharide deacetylase family protein [Chelatococcus sp. SYSU_G07232]MDJ1156911.1 polysaccharide deacetylase family protein [Chelatococcus sp. SYSU_G07232]